MNYIGLIVFAYQFSFRENMWKKQQQQQQQQKNPHKNWNNKWLPLDRVTLNKRFSFQIKHQAKMPFQAKSEKTVASLSSDNFIATDYFIKTSTGIVFCFFLFFFSYFSMKTLWVRITSMHDNLTVLGFNDTSTLVGHFVWSPTEREKRGRRDSRGDEREGQGRKRNRNESEETEEIRTFPLYPYLLQG